MSDGSYWIGLFTGLIVGAIVGCSHVAQISSEKPIKLSHTVICDDGKCDTTYKASTR